MTVATSKAGQPAGGKRPVGAKKSPETERLERRLRETEACLDAIRTGEVDALVIHGPRGEQIYTLKDADRPYRLIIEKMREGAVTVRPDGLILYSNRQFAAMLGIPLEEVMGADLFGLAAPESLEGLKTLVEQSQVAVASGDVEFRRRSGGPLLAYLSMAPLAIDGIQTLSVVVTDMTEERRTQDERARLAAIVSQSLDGVLVLDSGGKIVYANPSCRKISGYAASELVGLGMETFDAELVSPVFAGLEKDGFWKGRVARARKDGTVVELDVSVSPLRATEGTISNYIIQFRDVTHAVDMEKKIRQMERTEALGRLAGGVAHDLNNILMPIMVNTELLLEDTEPGTQQHALLRNIHEAALRQKALVSRILSFTRKANPSFLPVRMGPLVDEALKLLEPSLPASVTIRCVANSAGDTVIGDATELHELVTNLFTNAIDAMQANGGVLDVSLTDVLLGEGDPALGLGPGPYMKLTVRDTGCGIPAHVLDKIFDPFFTTKQTGKGTGIGLSIVRGIVKSHGGGVSLVSREGQGTEVTVCLPAARAAAPEVKPRTLAKGEVVRGRSVLIVDDEDMVLDTLRRAVLSLGHRPTAVKSAAGALALFRSEPLDFDLALVDQTMPHMNGLELAAELKRTRPDFPVILVTGYSKVVNDPTLRQAGVAEVVMKPLSLKDLAAVIDRVLAVPDQEV